MPPADRLVALAPVGRLLYIETALPPVAPAKRDALLRYAIEDKLTIDPSTVHAVIVGKSDALSASGKSGDTQYVVAAIDRTWLVGVLQWLKQAGRAVDCLASSAAAAGVAATEWAVVLDQQRGFAKRDDGFVYNFDLNANGEPPFGLTLALKEARDRQRAPSALVLQSAPSRSKHMPPDAPLDALARQWETTIGVPVKLGAAPTGNLQSLLASSKSANLLTGEFAPREGTSRWMALLRPAVVVLALIAATQILFTLIESWRLNAERQALEREMTQVFKAAFPAAQAIIDPPLQMQRNLQQLKRERGLHADTDAQILIARLTGILQALPGNAPSVTAIVIRDSAVTMDVVLASADQRGSLQHAIDRLPDAAMTSATGSAAAGDAGTKSPENAVRITLRARA